MGRAARDRAAHLLLLHHRAPRRGRRPDPGRPHQPGHQPGRQRGRPVRRPHRQLLHHAPRRARLLRRLPQPRRPAGRQGGPGHRPRARAARHRSRSPAPTCAMPAWRCSPRTRSSATTCKPTGRQLVIITGANSGGKSTFLRSVGVAQLMMQCGLFVTARSYQANVTRGIFTHFIREEDSGMTSGRLDDELRRMSAIAGQIRPRLPDAVQRVLRRHQRAGRIRDRLPDRPRPAGSADQGVLRHPPVRPRRPLPPPARDPPPCSCGPSASPTGAATTSSRSKTRSRPASEKTSTTSSAAGWTRTRRATRMWRPRRQHDILPTLAELLSLACPPSAQEGASFGRIPQRYARAPHEPAHGHGRSAR